MKHAICITWILSALLAFAAKPIEDLTTEEQATFRAEIGAQATIADGDLTIAKTNGLQDALNAKQATLVSGTNIKTINGSSVLGSGNLSVDGFDPADIGFYDDFARYDNGASIQDGVTMPLAGTAWQWKQNDAAAAPGTNPFIMNGGLQYKKYGGGYLAGNATPKDSQNFSFGFEFTREATYGTTDSTNFTINIGRSPIVDTSTHFAWNHMHLNISTAAITDDTYTWSCGWAVTVDHTAETFTLGTYSTVHGSTLGIVDPTLDTGDRILVSGTVPAELSTSARYYAIKVSPGIYKFAASKAEALAGTAIPLTTNGSSVRVSRVLEAVNRDMTADGFLWQDPPTHTRKFQGSTSGSILTTTAAHSFADGDAVMLEGSDLPEPLAIDTVYYAKFVSRYTLQLSATKGGAAITLNDNGSADQVIRGKASYDVISSRARTFMPTGRRNIITVTRRGDYLDYTLVGVGTITFYARDLDKIMGGEGEAVAFYWQSPPAVASASPNPDVRYAVVTTLNAAWIDAPDVQRVRTQRLLGFAPTLFGQNTAMLPARLDLIPQNSSRDATSLDTAISALDVALLADGGPQTAVGSKFKRAGRHIVTSGAYVAFPNWTDNTVSAVAELTFKDNITTEQSYNYSDSAYRNWIQPEVQPIMNVGDTETFEFGGTLVGSAFKDIKLWTSYGANPFNAGDLTSQAGAYVLEVTRKMLNSSSEVWISKMMVNGTLIGPQRATFTFPGTSNYYLQLNVASATANTITCDYFRHTLSRFPN